MRKIVMLNRVSVDGFYAGPNGEIDWFIHDPEVDKAAHELMNPDTILFGRVTYRMFEGYWPHVAADPNADEGARILADELNRMTKMVFSNTLREVAWVNTELVAGEIAEQVARIKQGDGADITIFGSGTIVQQLANYGLIDEYLITVTPVVLGEGKPLFQGVRRFGLKLLESRRFPSGNVLLHYETVRR
jgi:dihydrofolate reductase